MGLIDALGIAVRGMAVEQNAIRTASHNIANVDTPGYSRQRVIQTAGDPFHHDAGALGTGVEQVSIVRANDAVVERQILIERSALASANMQAGSLLQVEEILNEQEGAGIGAALDALYGAFSDLAGNPSGSTERQAVVLAAQAAADRLAAADRQLRDLQRSANAGIESTLTEINEISARVAELNVQIAHAEVSAPANDLRDQRDQLLRELSDKVAVHTVEQTDGKVYVYVNGGLALVQGELSNRLEAAPDPTNPFDSSFSAVVFNGAGNRIDITSTLSGGRLGGLLATRDGVTASAIRDLDTVAYNLAAQVNQVHGAGVGLDGSSGVFFTPLAAVEDSARDLRVDARVSANLDAIAAGQSSTPGDNRNALDLAALRDLPQTLYVVGDPPGPPSGPTRTLIDHVGAIGADYGQQAAAMQSAKTQRERVLETVENRRDELVGVSLDEEMANLIRLEAAFQANARVVDSVRRLFESLLEVV